MTLLRNRRIIANDRPWWLAGGIPANAATCVLQPIGANSLEASLVNLVNSRIFLGTNVCTSWSVENGWYNNGTAGDFGNADFALFAGLPNAQTSIIAKIKNPVIDGNTHDILTSRYNTTYINFRIQPTTGYISLRNCNSFNSTILATSGIYACGGTTAYIDALPIGECPAGVYGIATNTDSINCGISGTNKFFGYLQAIAYYRIGLTQFQVAALTAAMNAL